MTTTPESRKRRVIGTAGHIDHGKTALVRALTGIDADRLPEEKRRGITIDLGFASLVSGDNQIGFIDVPGHEKFVRHMLAGVGGIDSVLLVVSAEESIKPQTREHFAICRLLQIPDGVVAITKSDLVEPEMVDLVRMEVEELVRGSMLEGRPIIPVSSVTGEGIDALRKALIESAGRTPDRDATSSVFRLPVDRAFTMKGFGSVVTGTTISGTLALDDDVEVLPEGLRSRARRIQVHGGAREQAVAGERTSINLPDITLEQLHRGQQLVAPGALAPSQILTARLDLLPDSPSLKEGARIRFHHFSAELLGSVRLTGHSGGELAAGETAWVQFRLEAPVVAVAGDRFVVRRYSPARTIGGGVILDAHLGKLRRGTRPEIFRKLESGRLDERLLLMAKLRGLHGVSLADLQTQTGLRIPIIRSRLAAPSPELITIAGGGDQRWLHRDTVAELRKKVMEFLRSWFAANRLATGLSRSELIQRNLPPQVDAAVVEYLLRDLEKEKIIELNGDTIDVPGRSKELAGSEGQLAREIEKRFRDAALAVPPVSELIKTIHQKPKVIEGVIGYLVKTGVLVRLADGIYVHRDTVNEAAARLSAHRGETADVAWFKDFYGITRKVIIPLLEHFDRLGLTKRTADRRAIL